MIKLQHPTTLLILILYIVGCANAQESSSKASSNQIRNTTEYVIKVEYDSSDSVRHDTVTVTKKTYNQFDKIEHIAEYFGSGDTMVVKYIYDDNQRLIKEITKISNRDSDMILDYIYEDTLITQGLSSHRSDMTDMTYTMDYKYDINNKLKEITTKHLVKEAATDDTLFSTLQISRYDEHKQVIETETTDYRKPHFSDKRKYLYDDKVLVESKIYDSSDSLVSKEKFQYKYDQFQNWILMETFVDDKLRYFRTREIQYR